MSDAREPWDLVVESNRAWLDGRPEEVAGLFFEDVVAVFPSAGRRVAGRDALVQSYVDYCRQVKTHAFEVLDHSVDAFGDTAVVTYRFSVRYEAGGQIHDELGLEILVFARRQGRWGAVWRTQVPLGK